MIIDGSRYDPSPFIGLSYNDILSLYAERDFEALYRLVHLRRSLLCIPDGFKSEVSTVEGSESSLYQHEVRLRALKLPFHRRRMEVAFTKGSIEGPVLRPLFEMFAALLVNILSEVASLQPNSSVASLIETNGFEVNIKLPTSCDLIGLDGNYKGLLKRTTFYNLGGLNV